MSQKPIHRIFVLVSVVSFFGSTAFGAAQAVSDALHQPKVKAEVAEAEVATESQAQIQAAQLQQQEREYEVVLKQESSNQVALEGLVQVRLQMGDAQGAIEPLNKLVKLNPGEQKYKTVLAQVKQQVSK